MAMINSVLGPLDTANLGFTLMHEHIIVASAGVYRDYPELLGANAMERAVDGLKKAKEGELAIKKLAEQIAKERGKKETEEAQERAKKQAEEAQERAKRQAEEAQEELRKDVKKAIEKVREEAEDKISAELYKGMVNLLVMAPVNLAQMNKLVEYLRQIQDLRLVLLTSVDKGMKIIVSTTCGIVPRSKRPIRR